MSGIHFVRFDRALHPNVVILWSLVQRSFGPFVRFFVSSLLGPLIFTPFTRDCNHNHNHKNQPTILPGPRKPVIHPLSSPASLSLLLYSGMLHIESSFCVVVTVPLSRCSFLITSHHFSPSLFTFHLPRFPERAPISIHLVDPEDDTDRVSK